HHRAARHRHGPPGSRAAQGRRRHRATPRSRRRAGMSEDLRNVRLGFATRAIHLGYDPASAKGALPPPVYMTSTYAFDSAEQGSALFRGEGAGFIYGRTRNPTQELLEERMASLEGAEAGLAFASGIG